MEIGDSPEAWDALGQAKASFQHHLSLEKLYWKQKGKGEMASRV